MATFQAKTGWKRPRKRENKNYRSVPFSPRNRKFQKNSKKIQKIKKIPLWRPSKPKIGWKRRRKR